MDSFFHNLINRRILSKLLIHSVLATVLFILILPLAERHFKTNFIKQSTLKAKQLHTMLKMLPHTPVDLDKFRNSELKLIQLNRQDDSISNIEADSFFGNSADNLYHIALPVQIEAQNYILQLGYDETGTTSLLHNIRMFSGISIILYILLMIFIDTAIDARIAKSLQRLGHAARRVAAGDHNSRLEFKSNINEIRQLTDNLELMRVALISQSDALASREGRLSTIMANVIDALITIDQNGKIQSFNLAAERIFGYTASEIIKQNINSLFTIPMFNSNHPPQNTDQVTLCETQGLRKNGNSFHAEIAVNQAWQHEDHIYIVICRDISERKQSEAKIKSLQEDLERRVIKRTRELAELNHELKHQTLHDALTNLPNRVLLQDRLNQAILTAKRENHSAALLLSDLDRFKEINDTLGHHYGDLLLQQVAARLRGVLRSSDTVARLGGDEFAILMPNINDKEQITQTVSKIVEAIDIPFIFDDQRIHIGISIGIAVYPDNSTSPGALMRKADVAMYVAKRSNSDFAFYEPELDQHSISRLSLVGDLRRGLQQKQLFLNYQPNVDLHENKVIGVEALVRWQHPEKGLILPEQFITLAEHSGHIRELTAFVLEESLQQLHLWNTTGLNLRMSVNLSGRSLHDAELCNHIRQLLEQWEIKPECLQLEITERSLMNDPMQAMVTLAQLHEMGVKLSIDDFGTGYSSLAYLKQLPIHEIKIDQSFVHGMLGNNEDKVIIRSTIDLAHNMDHQVIAEGVDNEAALNQLREMGCDLAQGNYICEPVGAEEMRHWIDQTGWKKMRVI